MFSEKLEFLDELISWGNCFNIPESKLPRKKDELFHLDELCLNNYSLYKIPEAIGYLTNLNKLSISDCKLEYIPESIGNLINLKVLNLYNNNLEKIPESLCNLININSLNISGNKLSEFPNSIFSMTKIKKIYLNNNLIKHIPNKIEQLNSIQVLNLSSNGLIKIEENIFKIESLQCLNLSYNSIEKIPDYIEYAKNLEELKLANNRLMFISDFIGCLVKLKKLHIHYNQLKDIPKSVVNLKNIIELYIFPNEFTEIPEHIKTMHIFKDTHTKSLQDTKMIYQQKILFGSPGTGKSHKIDNDKDGIILKELAIISRENIIKTVFHPEYTYGDFVGKLMPITRSGKVEYNFYEGHFLRALAQAYKNIISANGQVGNIAHVALIIDEINRGNSAAIFGTTFQLLDRNFDGWSSYSVNINEITFTRLLELCDLESHGKVKDKIISYKFGEIEINADTVQKWINCDFKNRTIKIPPNLSILATMNTSDSSIYYMDSAFKRRWEWEFIDIDSKSICAEGFAFNNREQWINFIGKLNSFIKSNHKYIRGIEDKQIGHFFIKDEQIKKSTIQNKLMFFLWDSVFNRDKKPLISLLYGEDKKNHADLTTFGDFAKQVDNFIEKINDFNHV